MISSELSDYIAKQYQKGKSQSQIVNSLNQSGWPPEIIQEAISTISPPTKKHFNSTKILITTISLAILITSGIFLYQNNFFQTNANTQNKTSQDQTNEQTITPALNSQDLLSSLDTLFASQELTIQGERTESLDGCVVQNKFSGSINNNNFYSKEDSYYPDGSNAFLCPDNIIPLYLETYWISEYIYNRFSQTQSFSQLENSSDQILATKPIEHIKNFLGETSQYAITEVIGEYAHTRFKGNIKTDQFSGTITYRVQNDSKKIEQFEFEINYTDFNFYSKGLYTISYTSDELKIPMFEAENPEFLLNTFNDINNYNLVQYGVYTEDFLYYNEETQSTLTSTNFKKSTSKTCYSSLSPCSDHLIKIKSTFDQTKEILKNARNTVCKEKNTPTGSLPELYKNKLELTIANPNRNPSESNDYSIKITLPTNNEQSTYQVELEKEREYCFEGSVNQNQVETLLQTHTQISNTILSNEIY
jgi:hypothetical protein